MEITSIIKYEGDNSTFAWKHPKEDFNTASQLIVHKTQEAIFFLNGQPLDKFGSGRYTLETENIPLLRRSANIPTGVQTIWAIIAAFAVAVISVKMVVLLNILLIVIQVFAIVLALVSKNYIESVGSQQKDHLNYEVNNMARIRDMQGVPAHLEVLKSDGHRRHPSYCIFHDGEGSNRVCTNPQGPLYYQRCTTSKNCDYYEEKEK